MFWHWKVLLSIRYFRILENWTFSLTPGPPPFNSWLESFFLPRMRHFRHVPFSHMFIICCKNDLCICSSFVTGNMSHLLQRDGQCGNLFLWSWLPHTDRCHCLRTGHWTGEDEPLPCVSRDFVGAVHLTSSTWSLGRGWKDQTDRAQQTCYVHVAAMGRSVFFKDPTASINVHPRIQMLLWTSSHTSPKRSIPRWCSGPPGQWCPGTLHWGQRDISCCDLKGRTNSC